MVKAEPPLPPIENSTEKGSCSAFYASPNGIGRSQTAEHFFNVPYSVHPSTRTLESLFKTAYVNPKGFTQCRSKTEAATI